MDPDEIESAEVCSLCGATITADAESFAFGAGNALCFECATARGGRYDAERDAWDRLPDVSGIADEAYGASPHERRRGRS
jgi:hypothetical protein